MNVGQVFLIIALVLFLFAGAEVTVVPRPLAWGLFCLTLGLLLEGVGIPIRRGGS